MASTKVLPTSCAHDCGGKCLLYAHVEDGVVKKIDAPSHYQHDGRAVWQTACIRGIQYPKRLYDENRLKHPLIRVGRKGGTDFRRATWDEALDLVVKRLDKTISEYGNEAVLDMSRGGAYTAVLQNPKPWCRRLLNMIGGRVELLGVYSSDATTPMSMITYGTTKTDHSRDDLPNSKLILLWGWNPLDTVFGSETLHWLSEARKKGTRLVCIDPRNTATAKFCHQWISIRPSTDAAMLIAMAYVIISEKLHAEEFISKFTVGFDKYVEYVLGEEDGVPKTPEWAEKITGVSASITSSLAREYATVKPAALRPGLSAQRTYTGEQFARAASVLAAITGNIGIHGGNPAGASYGSGPAGVLPPFPENKVKIIVPIFLWTDLLLRGKKGGYPTDIKLGYITGGNILNQHGDVNKGCEALRQLEFFIGQDQFLNPTLRFADVILPACTFMERNDIVIPWEGHGNFLLYQSKLIEPIYESKTDMEIFMLLAERMELKDFNPKSEEEWLREYAAQWGIVDFEEFRRRGFHILDRKEPYVAFREQIHQGKPFATPSGKIEIYSSVLVQQNNPLIPPVPKWIDGFEGPSHPLASNYPLQLISPKAKDRINSTLYGNSVGESDAQSVWINESDAEVRGIRDGDRVEVFNGRGHCVVKAHVTDSVRPGVISLEQGAWYTPDHMGIDMVGNPNTLTSDTPTPYAKATTQHTALVEVRLHRP